LGRARTALRPQRTTWLASLRNLPSAAPFDPLGRAAPVLDLTAAVRRIAAARHGIVGGVLAMATVVASMAMMFSA
ncbi:MAG: hypothetical protein H0X17_09970, partial [Deltaproteobacteria bacterium]|nr:hypothetical protein [Deltaproteobacteria bacterium]